MSNSKLLFWEVHNFMSFDYGKCCFDENGIVTIFGYNDSGKSALLRALDVCFYNRFEKSQVSFIKSGTDYFRVLAVFSDGVSILRDKYKNGQSLYEMYKDGDLIFSTKQGSTLTSIKQVPEPIAMYLDLLRSDDLYINSRSCFEKQFLVQTSGSENYKCLNVLLRSQELSLATECLNADKNKLGNEIQGTQSRIDILSDTVKSTPKIDEDTIKSIDSLESTLDTCLETSSYLGTIKDVMDNIKSIVVYPELSSLDLSQVSLLSSLLDKLIDLSKIPTDLPALTSLDSSRLDYLISMQTIVDKLGTILDSPVLDYVSTLRLDYLEAIGDYIGELMSYSTTISLAEESLVTLQSESKELESLLKEYNIKSMKCPHCSHIIEYTEEGVIQ